MNIYKKQKDNFRLLVTVLVTVFLLDVGLFLASDLSAESTIPKVRHSLGPLDLSRPPSTEEVMAAGQLGGQLYPTADDNPHKKKDINLSFGIAIQEWNKHHYREAVKLFKKHIEEFPDSPWVSEAVLHMGCDAKYNGRYSEAETYFRSIIEKNANNSHEGARRLAGKAMVRLGVLKVLQNNLAEATDVFARLKEGSLDWRERTYAGHWIQRISRYKSQGLAMLKCGAEALAYLMEKEGNKLEAREVAEVLPDTDRGHSISGLVEIASGYGHELTGLQLADTAELVSLPLPAIMQINGKSEGDRGHYWVLDRIDGHGLEIYDPQSGRRFIQSFDDLSNEWTGKVLVSTVKLTEDIVGSKLTAIEMKESRGGCCGAPRPEDGIGDPGGNGDGNGDGPKDDPCAEGEGAPIWKVNKVNMNLFVKDIPLWYDPPVGPPVKIQLSYNSQSAIAHHEPFGNKWMFNYGSYLVVDTGGNVTVFMPDGRRDVYTPLGSGAYSRPFGVFNTLTWIGGNRFELREVNGTIHTYDIPAGTSSLQPFLIEIKDPHGQKLTFAYNSNVQMTAITDAVGRNTTLSYNAAGFVDRVTDPFGRSAFFEYDAIGDLTNITDMGGYWTRLGYRVDIYLAWIQNPKGTWTFYIEPADGIPKYSDDYPPPGEPMWANYRITVTNPLGGMEEFFYYGGCAYDKGGCGGRSWYVRPRDYVEWQSESVNNYRLNTPKTKYFFMTVNGQSRISSIEYPGGGDTTFDYDTSTGKPSMIKDYHNHFKLFTYNDNGLVTSFTDAKGTTTTLNYYPNNVDIQRIVNGLGSVSLSYNNTHDVTSITDRLNTVTGLTYNSYGQLTAITEAQGTPIQRTTELTYDAGTHRLSEIRRGGSPLASFTHDGIGRIRTLTDPRGLIFTYDYNNLDQITMITYPDSKFETFTYSTCCPRILNSKTDRAGLSTYYSYDALKRLTRAQGTDGTFSFEYDANGNLTRFLDAESRPTRYEYNLDDRLTKKIYADNKSITYARDLVGLITGVTNSRHISKNYSYDPNHNLLAIHYSDTTSDVTFTYDDYNRLASRTDGVGLTQFGYDASNRLTSIDGPWANDTIAYQYNELRQLTNLSPQGGQSISYNYDPIGRLTGIQSGSNTYTYSFVGVDPLVQTLTRPNGSITEYLYNDSLKRSTDVINKTSTLQVINSFNYTYNNLDIRSSETITNGNPITSFTEGVTTYSYNNLNQLLSTSNPNGTFTYDDDGNLTRGYTPEGYVMTMIYDAENRLKSAEYTVGQGKVHRTEYLYYGNSLLAEVKKFEDGLLINDTRYIRAGVLPLQERDGNNLVMREHLWGLHCGGGNSGLLGLSQGGGAYSYLYDGKGNVSAILDSAGNTVQAYSYDPFGVLMQQTGTMKQPYLFSTKEYDTDTGLVYYGYRFYSPSLGRWTSRDPLQEAGGMNLYGFVDNSPMNWIDNTGLSRFCYRPMSLFPFGVIGADGSVDDRSNLIIGHEHLFNDDGTDDGFGLHGLFKETREGKKKYKRCSKEHYDDDVMKEAVKNVQPGEYHLIKNNCQDWADKVRREYWRIKLKE